jgi:flagellar hook-length control protein FliK
MSLTFPISAPPAPPPPAPASSSNSADSAGNGRSFSDVLKETTASSAQNTPTDPSSTGAIKPDPAKKPDAADSSSESSGAGKSSSDESASNTGSATQAANSAGDTGDATSDATKTGQAQQAATGVAALSAGQKLADTKSVKKATDDPTANGGNPDAAVTQTIVPADQAVAALADKQKGNQKDKVGKSAATSSSSDPTGATINLAAQAAAVVDPSIAQATDKNIAPQSDAKDADAGKHAVAASDDQAGKSALRAEQPLQPGDAGGQGAKQKSAASSGGNPNARQDAASQTAAASTGGAAPAPVTAKPTDHSSPVAGVSTFDQQLVGAASATRTNAPNPTAASPAPAQLPPPPTAADFAAANHAQIVNSVHTQLLPNGGSIQLRLDPPDLGTMQVTVRMRDGMMSAEFQASNDQAAKLLSHSLGELKTQLETQGVSVEKLHVSSVPRETRSGSGNSESRQQREQSPSHEQQREQQRKEMIRRMWAKLAKGKGPLDMVA